MDIMGWDVKLKQQMAYALAERYLKDPDKPQGKEAYIISISGQTGIDRELFEKSFQLIESNLDVNEDQDGNKTNKTRGSSKKKSRKNSKRQKSKVGSFEKRTS